MERFFDWVLYLLVIRKLKITARGNDSLDAFELSGYTRRVLSDNGINTVKDGVMAYALKHDLAGVGKKTWNEFLSVVTK